VWAAQVALLRFWRLAAPSFYTGCSGTTVLKNMPGLKAQAELDALLKRLSRREKSGS
jgi:hypothetical protein